VSPASAPAGSRVLASWVSRALPSGSLKEQGDA
jgi:hypothetical protein